MNRPGEVSVPFRWRIIQLPFIWSKSPADIMWLQEPMRSWTVRETRKKKLPWDQPWQIARKHSTSLWWKMGQMHPKLKCWLPNLFYSKIRVMFPWKIRSRRNTFMCTKKVMCCLQPMRSRMPSSAPIIIWELWWIPSSSMYGCVRVNRHRRHLAAWK